MAKLNNKKIAWIIKSKELGLRSSEIAFVQNVTARRVNQMSLNLEMLETAEKAFYRKLPTGLNLPEKQ